MTEPMSLSAKQIIVLSSLFTLFIGFLAGLFVARLNPVIKYTKSLKMTCMVYNETKGYSMYCNPIDVEKYGNRSILFGFKLPINPKNYNISRIILCTYDLNNKRFVECHQYSRGVKALNETSD